MSIKLSFEEMEKLVDALLGCPHLVDPQTRQDIINQLAQSMGASVPYRDTDRAHVVQLVHTCLAYPNGFAELLQILKFYERDSIPMNQVLTTWSTIALAKVPKNFSAIPVNQMPQSSKWGISYLWLAVGIVGILAAGSLLSMTISLVLNRGGTPVVVVTATNTIAVLPTNTPIQVAMDSPTFTPIPSTHTPLPPTPYNMVLIPAGDFIMGSDTGFDNEKPAHTVYLKDYYIDKYETTNAEYAECVTAGKCTVPYETKSPTRASYYDNPDFANYPVINIDWTQAKNYCEFMGKRLPTEAEWEKAARGTDGRVYPWGNDPPTDKLLNYNNNVKDTTVVGSYPNGASWYGVMDMAGNVWEWTSSDYKPYPYKADDNSDDLLSNNNKTLRSGSWNNYDNYTRPTSRFSLIPSDNADFIGSRCAQ